MLLFRFQGFLLFHEINDGSHISDKGFEKFLASHSDQRTLSMSAEELIRGLYQLRVRVKPLKVAILAVAFWKVHHVDLMTTVCQQNVLHREVATAQTLQPLRSYLGVFPVRVRSKFRWKFCEFFLRESGCWCWCWGRLPRFGTRLLNLLDCVRLNCSFGTSPAVAL